LFFGVRLALMAPELGHSPPAAMKAAGTKDMTDRAPSGPSSPGTKGTHGELARRGWIAGSWRKNVTKTNHSDEERINNCELWA
jgi:hypothetical protein